MRKSITYTIEPRLDYAVSDCYHVYHSKKLLPVKSAWITNSVKRMKGMGLEVPNTKYKVIYKLHPEGEFTVKNDITTPFLVRVDQSNPDVFYNQIINCLLPVEWVGCKLNRKVVAL